MKTLIQFIKESTILTESAASDEREQLIADNIDDLNIKGLTAKKYSNPLYSDVEVSHPQLGKTFIEVKMSHTDQLGNVRISWNGQQWVTSERDGLTPLKKYMLSLMNEGEAKEQAEKFLLKLARALGKKSIHDITIPTTRGGLKDPKAVTRDQMADFLSDQQQYIVQVPDQDLGAVVTNHYNSGKKEPVSYIQAGDDFYRLGKLDQFGLNALNKRAGNLTIPLMSGVGTFKIRVGVRTEFYEIVPEIKIKDINPPESPYSILGSDPSKINPFEVLRDL